MLASRRREKRRRAPRLRADTITATPPPVEQARFRPALRRDSNESPGEWSFLGRAGLTTGAAHLVEAFGSEALKERCLSALYEGRWSGTMALTEPEAGSSLSDVATKATPNGDHFLLSGAKTFISAGDHDLTENIVHMVLARIEGAPAGIKGVSLFLVPKLRPEGKDLVPNDVRSAGLIHKIGWRALRG